MMLAGVKIVPHQLARDVRTEFKVQRMPIQKKRKAWRVVRVDINRPGVYVIGDTIFMHPDLVAKLPR
jgi:hypothetical protein